MSLVLKSKLVRPARFELATSFPEANGYDVLVVAQFEKLSHYRRVFYNLGRDNGR